MRAKYYPKIDLQEQVTLFGAVETNYPKLYTRPAYVKDSFVNIVEIDAQYCLHSELSSQMFASREHLYALLSGSLEDDMITESSAFASYRQLFISYYKRFNCFKNMVDTNYFFGNKATIIPDTIKPLQNKVNSYIKERVEYFTSMTKVSVLMVTHNYIYVGFRREIPEDLLQLPNVRVISNASV